MVCIQPIKQVALRDGPAQKLTTFCGRKRVKRAVSCVAAKGLDNLQQLVARNNFCETKTATANWLWVCVRKCSSFLLDCLALQKFYTVNFQAQTLKMVFWLVCIKTWEIYSEVAQVVHNLVLTKRASFIFCFYCSHGSGGLPICLSCLKCR